MAAALFFHSGEARGQSCDGKIDAGHNNANSCAVTSNGNVKCWGLNAYGQLGDGTTTNSSTPVSVSGITNAKSVSSGGASKDFACALLTDSSVKCWGGVDSAFLGDGSTTGSYLPVSVSGITNAVSISVGDHACAALSDGYVKCWGINSYGQLGDGTTTNSSTPVSVSGITNAKKVAVAPYFSCALLSDGSIKCWGLNGSGQLGNGNNTNSYSPVSVSGINNAVNLGVGTGGACAALSDGTIKCWGVGTGGQLGNGANNDSNVPVSVSGITTGSQAFSSGSWQACAVLSGGGVQCWGANTYGELGNGNTGTGSNTPVSVSGISTGLVVAAGGGGYNHSCAILADGSVKCWGRNTWGQLGNGTTNDSNVPVTVSGVTVDCTAPAAPSGLLSTAKNAAVDLKWTANGEGDLYGYNVYRATSAGGTYTKINASNVLTNSYTDSTPTNGTTYYYKITAADTTGNESAQSSYTMAKPGVYPPAATGKSLIAFRSDRTGNYEVYIMNSDGTGQTNLTNNSAIDVDPSFSADGTKIVFSSTRQDNYETFVMNSDGTGQTNLTNNASWDADPSFSPDGTKIVFTTNRDGNFEIYVMNSDGTGQTRLTNSAGDDKFATFSPDGTKIAFTTIRDGNNEIYIMNADGTNQIRLTNNSASDYVPAFSSDGAKIAFTSNRDGNVEVYIMNVDGTGQINLTNHSANDGDPFISPDGNKIAFNSDRDGNTEIYLMNIDGTVQTRLTNNTAVDNVPCFSGAAVETTPPTSSIAALSQYQSTNSFTVSWSGSDGGSGVKCYDVQYKVGTGGTWTDWQTCTTSTSATFGATSPVTVADGTAYYFQSRATDNALNVESYPDGSGDTNTTVDLTAPTITSLTSSTHTSQTTYYSNNTPSYSYAAGDATSGVANYYYLLDNTSTHTASEVTSTGASTTSTSFTSAAKADGVWTFHLAAKDNAGNVSSVSKYTTNIDTTAPTISAVSSASITGTSAVISWTTNESADSQIEYGTTTAYGSSTALDANFVTSHSLGLSGLTVSTAYHYRVKSKDAAGNASVSNDNTFTTTATADTTPPVISSVASSGVTANSATITWTTDEASDSRVDYGTTTAYGSVATNANLVTSHSVSLTGLSASTTYNYKVSSKDASNNSASSTNLQFTTTAADATPPVVTTTPSTGTPGATSVTITFTTDEPSVCSVEYGPTTSYGSSTAYESTATTSHSIAVTGLTASTTYNYRVNCTDTSNNAATGANQTVTTATPSDAAPPAITAGPTAANVTGNAAIITWTTDEASDSQVEYGTTTAYGTATTLDANLVTSHSVALSGLALATLYHYRARTKDAAGNQTISADLTFTTTGVADTTAPRLTVINPPSNITDTSVTLTWTTDELSTSQADYGVTTDYVSQTALDANFGTSHTVVITGLEPLTTYHARVRSKDASTNELLSADIVFTTTEAKDTTPPQSSVQYLQPFQTSKIFTVYWLGSDNKTSLSNLRYDVQYKDGKDGVWTDWKLQVAVTFSDFTGENGHTYYFRSRAVDETGNVESYPDDNNGDANTTVLSSETQNLSTFVPQTYGMVSFPLVSSETSAQSILGDDINGKLGEDWGVYYWNANASESTSASWGKYQSPDSIKVGQGYWLLIPAETTIDITGKPANQTTNYEIHLYQGWNQIGNPFLYDIDWKNSQVRFSGETQDVNSTKGNDWLNNYFYSYEDGGFKQFVFPDGVLKTWKGYFVKAKVECDLIIKPIKSAGIVTAKNVASKAAALSASDGWVVNVKAEAGKFKDTDNFFGVSGAALDGYDAKDVEKPPAMSPFVSVYFPHKDWGKDSGNYANDMRKSKTDDTLTQGWDMVVATDIQNENITLNFNEIVPLSEDADVVLTDFAEHHKTVLLKKAGEAWSLPSYSFNSGNGGIRNFRVMVGKNISDKVLAQTKDTKLLPLSLTNAHNFPNPDPAGNTTFKYTLSGDVVRVTIEVYTINGKRIDMIEGELDGDTVWKFGEKLASGVYIYRITVYDSKGQRQSKVNKLVVLK